MKRSRLPLVLIGKNGEAIKAVGLLNDTTRDVCDETANLYEAAGSYPPWMYDVKPGGAATHGPVLRGIKVC